MFDGAFDEFTVQAALLHGILRAAKAAAKVFAGRAGKVEFTDQDGLIREPVPVGIRVVVVEVSADHIDIFLGGLKNLRSAQVETASKVMVIGGIDRQFFIDHLEIRFRKQARQHPAVTVIGLFEE